MNKTKINFIKLTILLFGTLFFLQNCEKEYSFQKEILYNNFEINAQTVSINQAKKYFNSKNTTLSRGTNSSFKLTPDWNVIQQSEIMYTNALLTSIKANLNIVGKYTSKLLFVKVNNEMRNVVSSIVKHKTTANGNILDATIFFNSPNGKFIDAFKIKNGLFTNRIVYNQKKRINQAGFFYFYQQCEGQMNASFIGESNIVDSGGDPCMTGSPVDLGSFSSGGGSNNYNPVNPSYQNFINNVAYNQDSNSNNSNNSDTGSYNGGGSSNGITPNGLNNAIGIIFTNPPVESDLSGNCPEGYSKNQQTRDCDYKCTDGKVFVNGNCIEYFEQILNQKEVNENGENPLIFVNCISFEYYKPPGSSVTAAAVENMSEKFYAIKIKADGSTKFIETSVRYNRVYFTMPSWKLNGQAANETAEIVTAAKNLTQAWYLLNPNASKYAISDKWIQLMKAGMLTKKGQFSKEPPFYMRNASDYQTSLLSTGDCT
ncbi:hypothetical protein PG911_17835 [Tenacibaculum ovolyticum]|uniref:hypothetical protein n=1 Tax=Tenacibaculum ovolyticum TaxID=104270 RepID=UPI0007EE0739|nr:hypothetical protein [Tenacibaculum ovolyticum]WBX76460.1 hypothetical protein PG911_17835 [Tenacibaculum ovolyticum]